VSCKCEHMQHEHPPQRATPRKVEWRTHKTPEVASPTNTVGEMTLATAASVTDAAAAETAAAATAALDAECRTVLVEHDTCPSYGFCEMIEQLCVDKRKPPPTERSEDAPMPSATCGSTRGDTVLVPTRARSRNDDDVECLCKFVVDACATAAVCGTCMYLCMRYAIGKICFERTLTARNRAHEAEAKAAALERDAACAHRMLAELKAERGVMKSNVEAQRIEIAHVRQLLKKSQEDTLRERRRYLKLKERVDQAEMNFPTLRSPNR